MACKANTRLLYLSQLDASRVSRLLMCWRSEEKFQIPYYKHYFLSTEQNVAGSPTMKLLLKEKHGAPHYSDFYNERVIAGRYELFWRVARCSASIDLAEYDFCTRPCFSRSAGGNPSKRNILQVLWRLKIALRF